MDTGWFDVGVGEEEEVVGWFEGFAAGYFFAEFVEFFAEGLFRG